MPSRSVRSIVSSVPRSSRTASTQPERSFIDKFPQTFSFYGPSRLRRLAGSNWTAPHASTKRGRGFSRAPGSPRERKEASSARKPSGRFFDPLQVRRENRLQIGDDFGHSDLISFGVPGS